MVASSLTAPIPSPAPACIVIDGLNIIRLQGCNHPSLAVLLEIMLRCVRHGDDTLCICDANTRHELREHEGKAVADLYERLLAEFPANFAECPPRHQADPFILEEATAREACIISNDGFGKYLKDFRWLMLPEGQARLLKVGRIRDSYYFNGLRRSIPNNTSSLFHELVLLLQQQQCQ